mmetsp:Transcript_6126/g.8505  ORF Transcript_6126/g.8505 Transcript_6126/m.8505 type:complete len:622 (-) Transcript_6126:105-1970(-)|eukprot:CAMPEP_0184493514 /NCGR_PEP_ID=MMETSP0113_2-20130426/26200_1 /TAXON_ID=91329 /ORGANISM="Norrisiella sphaerica, Strain BC52" /LENGTH=621 /DNA_ID=CAMNT_0026878805 /DNA_START=34 /DNA_END=1899 /DNA_ORIENTATION=+
MEEASCSGKSEVKNANGMSFSALDRLFRHLYACKANVVKAFESAPVSPNGIFWWRLLSLSVQILKKTHGSNGGPMQPLEVLFKEAARVWGSIEDRKQLRNNKNVLEALELKIYRALDSIRRDVPKVAGWDNDAVFRFWWRYFGLKLWSESVEEFSNALRLREILENGLVVGPKLLSKMVENLLEADEKEERGRGLGENTTAASYSPAEALAFEVVTTNGGNVDSGRASAQVSNGLKSKFTLNAWRKLYARYGPMEKLYSNICSFCTTDGELVPWFLKEGGRHVSEQHIRQGVCQWVVRLGRLERGMEMVLTYRNADQNCVHTPIVNDHKLANYHIHGEPQRRFETVTALVADACKRMGWYTSGYALKEEDDKWKHFLKIQIEPKLFLGDQGIMRETLSVFPDIKKDLSCPLNRPMKANKLEDRISVGGSVLRWLDGNSTINSLTKHLIALIKPENTEVAEKALTGTFQQINLHMRKTGQRIAALENKVCDLGGAIARLHGEPDALQDCSLEQLGELETRLSEAWRRVKDSINKSCLTFPDNFYCPLTREVFEDPVMTEDGQSYERRAIELWLQNHDTSPMTNMPLQDRSLRPNISLRNTIADFRKRARAIRGSTDNGGQPG